MIRRAGATSLLARGCLWVFITFLIVTFAAWLLRDRILTAAGSFLVEDDGPHHADAAVVLGGDEYGERILTAAKLVQDGWAPYALVSYTYSFKAACDSSAAYAESKGYPASLFRDFPQRARSTRAEAKLLDVYFHKEGMKTILLVTSNYHTRRAANLMRHQDHGLKCWVIPAPDPYFSPSGWWKNREGQKTFLLEWMKTFATWIGD